MVAAKDPQQKYRQAARVFAQPPTDNEYGWLMVAICLTKLEEYEEAYQQCNRALEGFLHRKLNWHWIGEPNLLLETYVLAGQPAEKLERVRQAIQGYREDYRGRLEGSSPYAHYGYALCHLLSDVERNQAAFDEALERLLLAHRGMAKWGEIRESPEGYLCMAAMALARLARERGLAVRAESEYLSYGYLAYLDSVAGD